MTGRSGSGVPRMIRGSVVVHRRRCGKPTCRCVAGDARHEATVLSYSEQGRTRFVMLPAAQVAAVRAAVDQLPGGAGEARGAGRGRPGGADCRPGTTVSAAGHRDGQGGGFTASRERFDSALAFLDAADAAVLSHSQLEDRRRP